MADQDKLKTFEDLNVWRRSRILRNQISDLVNSFPSTEKFRLEDQLLRASRSVTANIAEGYGRFHYQENIQYCRMARGSLYEVLDHLICAYDENYISLDKLKELKAEIIECTRMLNGYINYLKKAKSEKSVKESEIYYTAE
jgi:four helix bundle protein